MRESVEGVADLSVREYLKQLAASSAVPGGGSAAAVGGAMGAALLAMVAKLSLKKLKSDRAHGELSELAPRLENLAQRLVGLGQEDVDAYRTVLSSRREAPETPGHEERLAAAATAAARVPLEVAGLAQDTLALADHLAPLAWEGIRSDLTTARALLGAAVEGGLANVAINLADLTPADRIPIEEAYRALLASRRPG